MITHKIEKNKPGFLRRLVNGVWEMNPEPTGVPKPIQQQQYPVMIGGAVENVHPMLNMEDRARASTFYEKNNYNAWVAGLHQHFKKGTLVTLRMYPYVPGRTEPIPYYTVDEIQEIRHLAQWCVTWKQPRAIGLRPQTEEGVYLFVAPLAVRPLTQQELFLVNLHNQKRKKQESGEIVENDSDYAG